MFRYLMILPPYLLRHVLTLSIIFTGGIALLVINYVEKENEVQHYVVIAKIIIADFTLMSIRNVIGYAVALTSMEINILKCNLVTIENYFPVICAQMIMVAGVNVKMMIINRKDAIVKLMPAIIILFFVYVQSFLSVVFGLCERFKSKDLDPTYGTVYVDHYDLDAVLPTIVIGILVILYYIPSLFQAFSATKLDNNTARLAVMHVFAKLLKAIRLLHEINPISYAMLLMGAYNIMVSIAVALISPVEGHVGEVIYDSMISLVAFSVVNFSVLMNMVMIMNCMCTLYKHKHSKRD